MCAGREGLGGEGGVGNIREERMMGKEPEYEEGRVTWRERGECGGRARGAFPPLST